MKIYLGQENRNPSQGARDGINQSTVACAEQNMHRGAPRGTTAEGDTGLEDSLIRGALNR